MIKNLHWSSYKVPDILVTFYWNLNFLDGYSKSTRIPNFGKIRPVGAGLFHADGWTDKQTDLTKLIGSFRNSVNAPKKGVYNEHIRNSLFSNTMRLHNLRTQTRSIKIEGTLLKLGSLKRKIKHKTGQTK